MYNFNLIKLALLSAWLLNSTVVALAESQDKPRQAPNTTVEVADSRNQIIRLTDKGLVPSVLKMKKEDSIVFFLNDTNDSLTSLAIEFGSKSTHCGGGKLQTGKNGRVSTVRPFGPNDFTSTCFHEAGEYPVKVYGLKKHSQHPFLYKIFDC